MKSIIIFGIICSLVTSTKIYSVDLIGGKHLLRHGDPMAHTLAWGTYEHEVFKDGWGKLYITTNNRENSHEYSLLTHYAAGYLEAALTSEHIFNHYWSWWDYTFKGGKAPPIDATQKWVLDQDAYARQKIKDNPTDEYYQALARVIAHNDGMYAGIQQRAKPEHKISWVDLLYLQGCGDMYEIIPASDKTRRVIWEEIFGEEKYWAWEQTVSCSALVKAADQWSDVFVGHTTWTSYSNMLRIYKYYNFQGGPKPYRVSFSAKPGVIYSKDDFYVLPDQELVVMETTNGVQKTSLYDLVFPQSLLTWQRVPMANQLSKNGQDWTSIFIRENSGTYNNQYIVVDMKTVQNGVAPTKDFIWISETMPGLAKTHDVTQDFINNGNVWPSYNIPFDKEIYTYAGFSALEGDQYSYDNCPRAKIFKRDHIHATNMEAFRSLIRYNDWENDPLSLGNPSNAIASRYDLRKTSASAFGAIDAKITSKSLAYKNQAWIQSGPSFENQPIFSWTPQWTGVHLGQPETFNFGWVLATELENTVQDI